MFIKSVKLKKTDWSYRLLYWVFPGLPKFYNFCPFFWLTILAMFVSPFKLIWEGLLKVSKPIGSMFGNSFDKFDAFIERRIDVKYNKLLESEDFQFLALFEKFGRRIDLYEHMDKCQADLFLHKYKFIVNNRWCKFINYINDIFRKDMTLFDENLYRDELEKKSKLYPVHEKKHIIKEVEIKNRPWWPKAIKIAKFIAGFFIGLVAIGCSWVLYKFGMFIGWVSYWANYNVLHIYGSWSHFLLLCLFVLSSAISIIAIVAGIVILIQKTTFPKFNIKWQCTLCQSLRYKIVNVFVFIGTIFSFLWIAIKSFKSDNCPEIIWTDEDKN